MKITKGILLLIATAVFFAMQAWSQTTVINENIQSWTARGSYGTYTQTISAGTVNMVQCIVQPSASASGTGSVGRVQLQGANGILTLPQVSSVSVAEFRIAAGGASRTVKLQQFNGSTWVDVTTFSGIGTTGATYTHTLNNSSPTQLRLASPSSAIYVHDIIIKDYAVASPTIEVTPTSLSGFTYIVGNGPSTAHTVTVSGSNLTANISLTAPANYEISLSSGSGYATSLTLTQSGGSVTNTTVYVRLEAGLSAGNYNGQSITASSTGATNKTVTCNGTVTTPTITVSTTALTGFTYNLGNGPSTSQNFTVSGSSLTANIGLAAPTNYEISLSSGSGYATSLTLTQSGGSVSTTTIYVRLKSGLPIANYNDELINITSTGAVSKTVECDGEVVCGTPATPVATAASDIDEDSFTSNWNAVSGAGGYYLDVYTLESGGTASDLFISEYVEGSSNNKYIEIFNGTGSSVDLSDYRLRLYANGSTSTSSDIQLSGTLANNETIVYKNSSAIIYSGTATTNAAINFNGDDAVALYKISTGTNVDIFGRIGEDPGTAWTSGSHSTLDKTLVRKSTVLSGVTTNPSSGFPTLESEWDVYNTDNVSDLGSHTFDGAGAEVFILENEDVGNVTSYLVDGLTSGTSYYYRVRAYNTCSGVSSNSNVISVVPVAPPDYSNIFISEISGKGYNGDWNNEYIEFSNIGSSAMNINGWKLKYYGGASLEGTLTLSGSIAANDAYVVAIRTSHTGLSPDANFAFGTSINENFYVILEDAAGNIIDQAGSSSDLFPHDYNYEFTNCGGNNLPVANWINLGSANGTPGVVNCVSTNASDGDGIAVVINNGSNALNGSDIWQRKSNGQKMRITISGEHADYLQNASVVLPAGLTDYSSSDISVSGDAKVAGTSFVLSGNTITVSGAEISNTKDLIIDINSFQAPEISDITDNGIDTVVVSTAIQGGTLTAIAEQPVIYTTIPIENIKHYNTSTGALYKKDMVVAVEGTSTIASGRLATASYDQFFIQEGEGAVAAGLCIRKDGNFEPTTEISHHYVIKGEIKLVRGGTINKTDARANLTAISNPVVIVSLGETVLPLPYITTIDELYAMTDQEFEAVDGVLMRIMNATKSSGTWPANNESWANIQIRDNGGSNTLRCYIFANTNIGGNEEPEWPVNMLTLVYNYDDDNDDVGDGPTDRQITPVYYDNFYTKMVWRGTTGNKLWSDTRNWSPMILPQTVDSVTFDNITGPASDYEVIIDSESVPNVKGISILPDEGKSITVIIPNTNSNIPAIELAAGGSGLRIGKGGVFINNSSATSGDPVKFYSQAGVFPPFIIENGGRYVHKTMRSSAAMTEKLSSEPGTENGTFEFDLPSASANFQISMSGKTFGNLELSANTAPKNYAVSGPTAVLIRGDFIVNTGVSINEVWSGTSKFENEFVVGGNLVFHGSGWTINFDNNLNQVRFNGTTLQTITDESGLLSAGSGFQKDIIVDNAEGLSLGSDFISDATIGLQWGNIILDSHTLTVHRELSYGAGLIQGITESQLNILGSEAIELKFANPAILGSLSVNKPGVTIPLHNDLLLTQSLNLQNGILHTGSHSLSFGDEAVLVNSGPQSFVDGAVTKTGSAAFVFPVGNVISRDIGDVAGEQSYTVYAPISLYPISGNAGTTVRYHFDEPPYDWWSHGGNMSANLVYVSSREYWDVSTTGELGQITLAWNNNEHEDGETCIHDNCPNGQSDQFSFADLTVAAYYNGMWNDMGVSASSGNHDNGSLTSLLNLHQEGKAGNYIITLGSLTKDVSLPVELSHFSAGQQDDAVALE